MGLNKNLRLSRENKINHPIPAPNHPKQSRAIGLIRGKYQPIENKLTQGSIITQDNQVIDSVLLGKAISVIKNHVDLKREHTWVVYPHNHGKNQEFHLQIAGIWEPENLQPRSFEGGDAPSPIDIVPGYFSVRGEIVFSSQKEQKVIVKIMQSPRKKSGRPRKIKLELKGEIPDFSVGHFFNFDILLRERTLLIQKAIDLGLLCKSSPTIKKRHEGSFPNIHLGR